MNPLTAQNLNRAIIYSKIEETRKYDECMYLLAIEIFKREGTLNSRMLRDELRMDYSQSLKVIERVKIDYIFEQKKKENKS